MMRASIISIRNTVTHIIIATHTLHKESVYTVPVDGMHVVVLVLICCVEVAENKNESKNMCNIHLSL